MAPDPTKPDAAVLLPCPFCGGTSIDVSDGFAATCNTCLAEGPIQIGERGPTAATRYWNHRAAPAQRPESAGSPVGDRDLALGLLCGLHPQITCDEPMEVAQQIFDHVQADRKEASRRIARMQETIDALLRQLRAAPAQVAAASAQGAKRDAGSQAAQREDTERLDWLEQSGTTVIIEHIGDTFTVEFDQRMPDAGGKSSLRAAIDAARAAGAEDRR